jgi:hypothetical protein
MFTTTLWEGILARYNGDCKMAMEKLRILLELEKRNKEKQRVK